MKLSQTIKLLILYIIFGVVSFLIVAVYAVPHYTDVILHREADKLYRTAVIFVDNYGEEYYSRNMDDQLLKRQMVLVAEYTEAYAWVVGRDSTILIDTASQRTGTEVPSGFSASEFVRTNYLVDRYNDAFGGRRMLSVCVSVTVGYETRGYLLMHEPVEQIIDFSDGFLNVTYLTAIFIYMEAFVLIAFHWIFTERVALGIVDVAGAYMEKKFEVVPPKAHDKEYEYIISTLKYMAQELATLEVDQQKFISNISHDFRSPLTSVKGYITAMMDGTIPPEMQERYLGIVLSEVDRLSNMTSGLLELNRYGSHGRMILDREPFDLVEVIRETARLFEGRLLERHMTLALHLSDTEMTVFADRGKISRVLHNLLDNSIKFSDNNSAIRIEAKHNKNKIQVSVKDQGIGIPSDQLGKIWDRFYKTDVSRGKDKTGSGIGLSIVKEIITAHGENISVVSTEGGGCEFIFSLPEYEEDE